MSDEHTLRRERSEKTIAGETFDINVKHYALDDGKAQFKPPADADIVTQAELLALADDEALLDRMESEIVHRKQAIIDRMRSGKAVVEPGAITAAVIPHFKQQRVSWKEAFIDACGEADAKKLESAAKGPKEISSYSLEIKRVDGGKA